MNSMTEETLRRLVDSGEGETIEFKTGLPDESTVSRVLASFANTRGGTLILGVSDKGELLGYPDKNVGRALQVLTKIAMSMVPRPQLGEPSPGIEAGNMQVNGKILVYLTFPAVPEHYRPVLTSRGEYVVRKGDHVQLVDMEAQVATPTERCGTVPPREDEVTVFIAMSFREEEEPALVDYYQAILRAIKKTQLPLRPKRMDLEEGDYEISQQIMNDIDKADIVLADFTLSPRNVYFELGYARGCKSAYIVQTARKDTNLEFDVRNWKTYFYRNATELEAVLPGALKKAYEEVKQRRANKTGGR